MMKTKRRPLQAHPPAEPHLGDVLSAVAASEKVPDIRRRDLLSAVKRVAILLGDVPARIPLNLRAIGDKLATVNPVAAGFSRKTFANIRANFMAAVQLSGLKSVRSSVRVPLDKTWSALIASQSRGRARFGLSRLARYASSRGLRPEDVNTAIIASMICEVREASLHRKPNGLHRLISRIWNELAAEPRSKLQQVVVPCFTAPPKWVPWQTLTGSFRKDCERYLTWCGGADNFAADARRRALAPRTVKLRHYQIRSAVTALVESGVKPAAIRSLADLVSPQNFIAIMRRRDQVVGGAQNAFNGDLAHALVMMAVDWVEVAPDVLTELKRVAAKVVAPQSGLTDKNKTFLRQFDDPAALERLLRFPAELWGEVKRDRRNNQRTLVKAQTAIAVAILTYMPLRLQNLVSLTFDTHLFLQESARATSSLEIPGAEVKNKIDLTFDIPRPLVEMLIAYRDKLAPSVTGKRPQRLFIRSNGTPKSAQNVACLIMKYLNRRAGIKLTPHQFRHLSAKIVLDANPGNFETVRQLLAHKSLNTTVGAYTGIDSRRAGRHHHHLIEAAIAAGKRAPIAKKRYLGTQHR